MIYLQRTNTGTPRTITAADDLPDNVPGSAAISANAARTVRVNLDHTLTPALLMHYTLGWNDSDFLLQSQNFPYDAQAALGTPLTPILAGFEAIDRAHAVFWRTAPRPRRPGARPGPRLGGQRRSPRARAAGPGPTPLRPTLVHVRPARLDGRGHDLRGAGRLAEVAYFTSFYSYSLTRGLRGVAPNMAQITRFDDRWGWIVNSVVPRFRRFDADPRLIDVSLRRIVADARIYASMPCIPPRTLPSQRSRRPPASVFHRG